MKKTIFDLSFKEGKKLDLMLMGTSYYKQYLMGYIISLCSLLLIGIGILTGLFSDSSADSSTIILSIILLLGFSSIIMLLFWFKRFELIKKYYDEKYKEDKINEK